MFNKKQLYLEINLRTYLCYCWLLLIKIKYTFVFLKSHPFILSRYSTVFGFSPLGQPATIQSQVQEKSLHQALPGQHRSERRK